MLKTFSQVNLPDFGALKVNLPVITLGSGSPKVSVICGMHGNEQSGLLVLNELINSLEIAKGQVDFFPSVNPVAQALKVRDFPNPMDNRINLNRCFPGSETGEFTPRNAFQLLEKVKDSDLVIDLHTFSLPCPIVGVLVEGPQTIMSASQDLLELVGPDIIWKVAPKKNVDEAEFKGALGYQLHQQGIKFFAIELPIITRVTEEQVSRVVKGIKRVLRFLGMINQPDSLEFQKTIPVFSRFPYVKAPASGLFQVKKKLLDQVKSGEEVGQLVNLHDFSATSIKSPHEGTLIILLDKDFVRTGDKLFSIAINL